MDQLSSWEVTHRRQAKRLKMLSASKAFVKLTNVPLIEASWRLHGNHWLMRNHSRRMLANTIKWSQRSMQRYTLTSLRLLGCLQIAAVAHSLY